MKLSTKQFRFLKTGLSAIKATTGKLGDARDARKLGKLAGHVAEGMHGDVPRKIWLKEATQKKPGWVNARRPKGDSTLHKLHEAAYRVTGGNAKMVGSLGLYGGLIGSRVAQVKQNREKRAHDQAQNIASAITGKPAMPFKARPGSAKRYAAATVTGAALGAGYGRLLGGVMSTRH